MLQSKETKYQKRLLKKKRSKTLFQWKTNKLKFGNFGLQSLEEGFIRDDQLQAGIQVIKRKLKREGALWVRIFPSVSMTKKPNESRMGKGKGNIAFWGTSIKSGQIIYEITGVSFSIANMVLKHGGGKLPVKTQIIIKKYK